VCEAGNTNPKRKPRLVFNLKLLIVNRPRQEMTPAPLVRLQTHKAELLAMLMIQQVHDLAEVMSEAWQERLAICTADDIPLAEAEQTSMTQLQAMIG
jgi:hypothetical protein